MKEIKAIVRQYKLEAVLDALHAHPEFPGVTVSVVRGFGRTVGRRDTGGDLPVHYGTVEMMKLECVLNDEDVDAVIELIQRAAHTGNVGDGKIIVYAVDQVVKIRNGERLTRME